MLCLQELWLHFLPEQVPPFQVLAHVKFPRLSLHGAAGSQPWSKFKHCGSEHASSCQKDPNLSVPGPLGERVFGQGNQRLTPLNTNQTARVEGFPSGAWLSFSSIQTPFARSQLHGPHPSLIMSLPSRSGTKLCELGGHTPTWTPSLRLPGPTRPGWTQQGCPHHTGTHLQWSLYLSSQFLKPATQLPDFLLYFTLLYIFSYLLQSVIPPTSKSNYYC